MLQFIARVALPFLLFVYIAVESYLKLHHSSVCSATGCKLAGELLRFKSIYLHFAGLFGASLLMTLGYLSLRKKAFDAPFRFVAYGAVAFEATILGYQLYANPEPCLFCVGVFTTLLLIALLSDLKRLYIPVAIVGAIVVAMGTLAVFHNQSVVTQTGNYLIYSPTCPHCKKVRAYLAEHHIDYTPVNVKEASARFTLKFLGIDAIPVWVESRKGTRRLYVGDEAIIAKLENKKKAASNETSYSAQNGGGMPALDTGFLQAGGDEGCAISIEETPSCESNESDKATP